MSAGEVRAGVDIGGGSRLALKLPSGGYGEAAKRPREWARQDLDAGYINPEQAETD